MILTSLLLTAAAPVAPALAGPASPWVAAPSQGDLFVLKARRVELGDGEVMEHAVMLIEDGVIVTMGQDLPIERGIPVIELDDDQIVMPGLVNSYSRYGMSGNGFNDARPQTMASSELYPSSRYDAFLENGITTVAQYPAGRGMPGQAVALRPLGSTKEEMVIEDGVYLKAVMGNSSSEKRNVRDGFKKADEYLEKVEKEREKFEKKNSKKTTTKKKDEEKKGDEKKGDEEGEKEDDKKKPTGRTAAKSSKDKKFTPPEPDPRVKPFLDLREGTLQALFSVDNAAAYVHLIDAIGDEEFEWHLRVPLSRDINIFHVKDKIGERGVFTIMEPQITLMPGTMRQRNLPAEFDRAGAKLVLVPRVDSPAGFESWLGDIGTMISAGLDRASAVRAITQYPAQFLGLGDTIGTLGEGKRANLIVFGGDPFQPGTKIDAVMLDGEFVIGGNDQ